MILKIFTFLPIILLFGGNTYSSPSFTLLQIECDGGMIISSSTEQRQIAEKNWIGDVQRGMLFNNDFYAVDQNNKLIVTNINSMKFTYISDFNRVLNEEYHLWRIVFVDEERIIVSAYKHDKFKPIGKQRTYFFFQFDRDTATISKISIPDCCNDFFSLYKSTAYYTNTDGNICSYNNNVNHILGIKGISPSISPDGSKLAYISFGIIMEGVYIFDLQTKKIQSVIKFFGPQSVYPTIRWSDDSLLLGISKQSDIFATSLYVNSLSTKKNIYEFKKSHACNWFFIKKQR